jgi:hypothetical protein
MQIMRSTAVCSSVPIDMPTQIPCRNPFNQKFICIFRTGQNQIARSSKMKAYLILFLPMRQVLA